MHLRDREMHLLAAGISLRMAQQERRHSGLRETTASVCDGHRLSIDGLLQNRMRSQTCPLMGVTLPCCYL